MARFHATSSGQIPFTAEEEAARDAEEAAWAAAETSRLALEARKQRDILLASCDWRVTKALEIGVALEPDWASYRQGLRDLPQQPGFPRNIIWPVEPS
jgi:hypothetical protein